MYGRRRVLHLLTLLAATLLCWTVSSDDNREVRVVSKEEYPAYEAYNQGVAFARSNDNQQAMKAYHRALELKPDLCEAHQNMATLYGKMLEGVWGEGRVLACSPPFLRSAFTNLLDLLVIITLIHILSYWFRQRWRHPQCIGKSQPGLEVR